MNKIEEFLKRYNSKKTITYHRYNLNQFMDILNVKPESYFSSKRNYEKDVETFFQHINKPETPPYTIRGKLGSVRIFLDWNDVDIKRKVYLGLQRRIKGKRARTIDRAPKQSELKMILSHASILYKSLFLVASSSGMRINEILQIEESDIDKEHNPCMITIPATITKTGDTRIVFISNEAKDSIISWLKIREDYIDRAVKKTKGHKFIRKQKGDSTLFPVSYNSTQKAWATLLKKAGLDKRDKSTNRHELHIHTLRKYFRTRMGSVIPTDIVEQLMGHEGYLTNSYRRYDIEELGEYYNKGVHSLLVWETAMDESRIQELEKELRSEREDLDLVNELYNKLLDKIEKLEKEKGK